MSDLAARLAISSDDRGHEARPGYRWHVGDLRTGRILRTLDFDGPTWGDTIDDAGTLEGDFPLRSGEWPAARSDATPGKSFLAVSYLDQRDDEHWIAGGPIWTSRYSDENGVLSIGAAALSTYFDHRKLLPVLSAGQNPAVVSLTYTGAQLGLIAKRLVELAQSHTGGQLPIVLPTDAALGGPGATHTRTYPGYELGWVGERLQQLTEVEGGPEVQFVPRRRADDPRFIEWVMRIGVAPTMMLTQAGPAWLFDRTTPESPVTGIDVTTDASKLTFRSWAAGQGEAEGRPIRRVDAPTLVEAGWPLLESEVTGLDTVSEAATLDKHAANDLLTHGRPMETWTVTVRRDTRPHVGLYRAGDWCVLRIRDHVYLPPGDHPMRIVARAGGGDVVVLQMQPRLGEV